MIRVLEVEASKGWGGQEKRTVRLANYMPSEELCTLFAAQSDSYLFRHQDELGIEVEAVKMRSTWDPIAVVQLVRLIKKHAIDIVVTHSGRDGWLGGFAAKIAGAKCVRVRHLQTPFRGTFSYRFLSDVVVAVSDQVRNYLISRGVKPQNARTVYTGVDTAQFSRQNSSLREELGISGETILIGIVAILRGAKNHKHLIDAVQQLSSRYDVRLVIAGDGPQAENLKNYIAQMGIGDRVAMLGFRSDTVNILSALDIFALPSRMEALGTALLEAQSCGVPVVGARVGGIPECIDDGRSGFLFESGNIDDLVAKLEILCKEPQMRQDMGKRAKEWVEQRFSVHTMVDETLKLYKELLDAR